MSLAGFLRTHDHQTQYEPQDSSNAEWSGWLPIPPHQTALIEGQRCTLSEKAEKPELLQLWAGQSANLSRRGDATALLQSMVSEVTAIFRLVLR
jgi:hypothetical protein